MNKFFPSHYLLSQNDVDKCVSICTDLYRSVLMCTDVYRGVPTCTGRVRSGQSGSDPDRSWRHVNGSAYILLIRVLDCIEIYILKVKTRISNELCMIRKVH